MTYRVGIVGTGENARDHGRACGSVGEAELVAICDISQQALDRFGAEFKVSQRYTRLEDMLAQEELDIVIISTWGVYHAPVCKTIAASRIVRAILVEKPLASSAAEAEEMIQAARESGVLLTEGFKFRHHPQHLRVKEIVDSGRIGEVKSVRSTLSSPLLGYAPLSNWRFDRKRGGGSVFDTASYPIHFARYIVGAEPKRVYALGTYIKASEAEVSATILLEFPGGVTATLTSSYQYGYCQSTEILGTRGWILMDLPYDQRSVRDVELVEKEELPASIHVFYNNFDTETLQFAPVDQFQAQLRHLCECLDTGRPPRISPEFSLGNMRVIDAVFASMRSGQAMDLSGL